MDPLPVFESHEGPTAVINGKTYDWFRSNGYLGLHTHPDVITASIEATRRYGLRTRPSRAIGSHPPVTELYREACQFFDCEAVALVGSGYAAAAALIAGLQHDFDVAFIDGETHYSLVDALKLTAKTTIRFRHRDPEDLRKRLDTLRPGQRPLVATDGLFPVSGSLAPLPEYCDILKSFSDGTLCVDDSHGLGTIGTNGRGSFEFFHLTGERNFTCSTLNKAIGASGGIIPGSQALVRKIQTQSCVAKASSLPSPGMIAAAALALKLCRQDPSIRQRLAKNIRRVRLGLHRMGLAIDVDSPSPILCLDQRNKLNFQAIEQILFQKFRIAVLAVSGDYPSTPQGGALTWTVFANHTDTQIDRLLTALKETL